MISGPISGYILQNMNGIHGFRGWQWMFLLEGFPSVLFGVIAYLWLADRPANAKWLSVAEKDAIARDLAERSRNVPGQVATHREAFRDLAVYRLSAVFGTAGGHKIS